MPKRIALLAALLALAVPARASATVTIKVGGDEAKYRELLYPDAFRIKGKTGDYRGPVALEVDDFPYDGGGEVATVNTNDKGEYVFPKVRLDRNSNVRVRAGSEFSKTIELYVHPGVKIKVRRADFDHDRVVFDYIGHPGFTPPDNSFFVYLLKRGSDRLRRLGGTRRLTQIADGRWRYEGLVRLPAGDYYYGLDFCLRGLAAGGYGRAWHDKGCGDKVVTPIPHPR